MTAPLLEVAGVGRRFGELTALSDIHLTVPTGGRHAVIGPNGAGKTTLLNLVAGTLPVTAGRIVFDGRDVTGTPVRVRARLGIGRTWQHPATFDRLSVATNLALAHHRTCTDHPKNRWRPGRICGCVEGLAGDAGLGGYLSTAAGRLPYGMRRRLEVAMALAARPRLLLLDEPTAGLAAAEIDALASLLGALPAGTAVLVVDHHIDFVAAVADTITVLHHGQPITAGTPDQVRAHPDVRRVYLTTTADTTTGQAPTPSDTKPKPAVAAPVLAVADLCAGYGGASVLNQVNIELGVGQIVAVVGRSGAGKTTLINTIAGLHPARSGRITVDNTVVTHASPRRRQRVGIGIVPQGRHLFADLTVDEHLRVPQPSRGRPWTVFAADQMYELFPTLAGRRRHKPGQLSGGEQQMLATAHALVGKPRVLLLDEPSEGLAPTVIDNLAQTITDLAAHHQVTVLLAEQNLPLALRVADQVCVLHRGQIALRSTPDAITADQHLLDRYLGAAAVTTTQVAP